MVRKHAAGREPAEKEELQSDSAVHALPRLDRVQTSNTSAQRGSWGGCLGIGRPRGPPKGPENGPRGPPHGPSGSQNGPKRPQEDSPKRDPIGPQGSPKRALRRPNKESPKRAPRDLSPRGPCECHDSRLVIIFPVSSAACCRLCPRRCIATWPFEAIAL